MEPKILFLYQYVLGKREPLASALSVGRCDDKEQISYWIGDRLGKLKIITTNEFLKRYLK